MTNPIEFDQATAREFPRFRVRTRVDRTEPWIERRMLDRWDRTNTGDLAEFQDNRRRPGCVVEEISRVVFPAVGMATFTVPYGEIDGKNYTLLDDDGNDTLWNWLRHQVAIDALDDAGNWRTVFWGTVEDQEDTEPPGWQEESADRFLNGRPAVRTAGRRTYRCLDLTYALAWSTYKQHYYQDESGGPVRLCTGSLGFNIDGSGQASKNRGGANETTPAGVYPHMSSADYAAERWMDGDIIETLLYLVRDEIPQELTLVDEHALTAGSASYPVADGAKIRSLIEQVLRRERGLGCAFLDWTDTVVDQDSIAYIRVLPQLLETVTVGGKDFKGASAAGTTQSLIFTGDMRIDAGSFYLKENVEESVDAVETLGEKIQVAVSLQKDDGLEQGWTSGAEVEFDALTDIDVEKAESPLYDAVYRVLKLKSKTETTGTPFNYRYDYRLSDVGGIITPGLSDPENTSIASVRMLPYIPCPGDIKLEDATHAGAWADADATLALVAFDKFGTKYYPSMAQVRVSPNAIEARYVEAGNWRQGKALIDGLTVICGVELPHRVRRYRTRIDRVQVRKVQTIYVEGAHLWLGHRNAIIGVDSDAAPVRLGTFAPEIYRDDRVAVDEKHELAASWYLATRQELRVTYRRTCALLPTFTDANDTHDYPQLGHYIQTADVAGVSETVGTIVSAIHYRNGDTTITTDWKGLA